MGEGLGGGGGEICWQIIEFFELEGKKKNNGSGEGAQEGMKEKKNDHLA